MIVRFPPSPTGHLHLGSARTALFNYLWAKKNNGQIIFRWEDTDRERSEGRHEVEILEGLKWLGMDFEKLSPHIYRQTDNIDFHKEWLRKLWEQEKIFPCFITNEQLDARRAEATKNKENFVFWSPSRDVSKKELQSRMDSGESFVWRLRVPKNREITFHDLIRGNVTVNTNTLGDFTIARSDGSVLYPLANVLDDMQQGVTHILRGEDGISNTPKQILLFEAIEASLPLYGHIPLVIDLNGKKLSKRNVDPNVCVLISDFQKAGFLPEAVVNGLVFLGWNPKTTEEIFSLQTLEKVFDLKNVNASAARYDFDKMLWYNGQWMKKIPLEDLIKRYNNFAGTDYRLPKHGKAFAEAREKAKTLEALTSEFQYLIKDPGLDESRLCHEKMGIDLPSAKSMIKEALQMLESIPEDQFDRDHIKEEAVKVIERLGCKNGQFLWPFRVALSNNERSSGPFEIAEVIGKEEAIKRLRRSGC